MTAHFAQQGGRLDAASRVRALQAGLWQCSDNTFVPLRTMPDGHLVNALLRLLEIAPCRVGDDNYTPAQHARVCALLSAEVARRNLQDYALAEAAKRDGRRR